MKVLLVEDNDDLRLLYARVLRKHGCTVREAEDGHAALEMARQFEPHLVVTDLMMPGMDGIRLITLFKQSPATAHIPVVAISAVDAPEFERRAREAGAIDFVVKPVDIPALLGRLTRHRP